MTRLTALLAAGALLWTSAAVAQTQIAPSAKSLSLARRYLDAAQAQTILSGEGPVVAQFMLSKIPAPAGGEAKANEVRQAMLEAADAAVAAQMPTFMDRLATIYAEVFTEKELSDIVAFYDSASGKAFVAKTGAATAPVAELIHSLGGAIQSDTQARFCAREPASCPPAKAP
jgi:hypothetical protein